MRKVLITLTVTILAVVLGSVGADFGAALYAEYRLARTLRAQAQLASDPSVVILGFPFFTQAADRRYDEVELKVSGVEHPLVGNAALEATMHDVDLSQASWLVRPDAGLPVGKVESRIIIDSAHLGRFMDVKDLVVGPPPRETNDATGGSTESGISSGYGVVFTGTPKSAGVEEKVSVSVDLLMDDPAGTTLTITATEILVGPNTADQQVPDDKTASVLAAFTSSVPGQKLPFDVRSTRVGARGSDVIIEGITTGVTVRLDAFRLW